MFVPNSKMTTHVPFRSSQSYMYFLQTILFSIPTVFIFSIITCSLIVGFVSVMTHQMAQKIHVIVLVNGFYTEPVFLILLNKQV
jgi:hypothetical protein